MDLSKVEKISPECWLVSQFSIARHYGGCTINGKKFVIDPDTNYLVREDIYKRELKDKKKIDQVMKAERQQWENSELFGGCHG